MIEVFSRTWDEILNKKVIECNEEKARYLAAELKKNKISFQLLSNGILIPKKTAESELFKKIENAYKPSLVNLINIAKQKSAAVAADNPLEHKKSKNRNEPHR